MLGLLWLKLRLLLDQRGRLDDLLGFGNGKRELFISGSDFDGCPEWKHMMTNTGRVWRRCLDSAFLGRFDHCIGVVSNYRFWGNGFQDLDGRWKTLKIGGSGHSKRTWLDHCHGWRSLGSLMTHWRNYFLLQ